MDSKYLLLLSALVIAISCQDLTDTLSCLKDYIQTFKDQTETKLYEMFSHSYPNTLSTTVQHFDLTPGSERTYIITGDIEAMWLRDSTNQFLPYMKISRECPKIKQLALGLLNMQAELIMIDSYTNAFKLFEDASRQRHFYLNDMTETLFVGVPVDLARRRQFATKAIWERKFQLDSLASFLRLAYEYHKRYNSIDFVNINFLKAVKRIITTLEEQRKDQHFEKNKGTTSYTFVRNANQLADGKIKPSFATGMIKTGFRPSDDANDLPFNVPGNAMISTYLGLVSREVLAEVPERSVFRSQASILQVKMNHFSETIREAIYEHGIVTVGGNQIFAYEVNGKGDFKAFDDANLPSLLSLPYLQFVSEADPIYLNTRYHILSKTNPYFYQNGNIRGIGSSHTPPGNVWPLALITQVLTTSNKEEIMSCLQSLKAQSQDNLIHQSFNVRSPASITRSWFAWANSLFGEMIITLSQKYPDTLR